MKGELAGNVVEAFVAMLIAVCSCQAQSTQASSTSTPGTGAKPLLLEKNEGEQRIWRDPPPGGFMLKVSPKNNGSRHLVLGTEDLFPGDSIPRHQHLGQDEIVFIQTGTLHARLGDQERDLHTGGMAFIPAYTWVSFKNTSTEPASMVFIFSAPGFEIHLRCESVPANAQPTPMTASEHKQCDLVGHVIYKEPEETPKK
jgi:quercetin dioxygenase-like cupin family protein